MIIIMLFSLPGQSEWGSAECGNTNSHSYKLWMCVHVSGFDTTANCSDKDLLCSEIIPLYV